MPDSFDSERRRAQRISFIAAAEVIDAASSAKFSARTSDLSRVGCYIDNPFSVGTSLLVRITKENDQFEAAGRAGRLSSARTGYGHNLYKNFHAASGGPGSLAITPGGRCR